MKPTIVLYVRPALAIGLFVVYALTGCVHPHAHVIPPSTAAVQGGIDKAKKSNEWAARYNDLARGSAELIDAKAAVIRKFWDSSK